MALKHAAAGEVFHLTGIDDPAAQTVALARTSSFEAVHLVVRAGESLPAHKVDGSITLHCLEGHVALEGGKSSDMRAGDWLYLEPGTPHAVRGIADSRSEEHTSELQSLMRISYAVFCLKKKKRTSQTLPHRASLPPPSITYNTIYIHTLYN